MLLYHLGSQFPHLQIGHKDNTHLRAIEKVNFNTKEMATCFENSVNVNLLVVGSHSMTAGAQEMLN